jgi:serine/threonine protein kinase
MQMDNNYATYSEQKEPVLKASGDTPLPSFKGRSIVSIQGVDYRISEKALGSGAYGIVYKGTDDTGKVYALKVMEYNDSDSIVARSELGVYELLRDICSADASGYQMFPCLRSREVFQRKYVVMVMDLIVGETLKDWFGSTKHQKMSDKQVLNLMWLIMEPIRQMHMIGVSHNDLKVDNMMPRFDLATSEPLVVTIFDFGLSCTENASRKDSGTCHTQFASDQVNHTMDPNYHSGMTNRFQADVHAVGYILKYILKAHTIRNPRTRKVLDALVVTMIKPDSTLRPTIRRAQASVQRLRFGPGDLIYVNNKMYTIQRYIASGTYGSVFHVEREGRTHALKIQSNRGIVGGAAGLELAVMRELPSDVCTEEYIVCLEDSEVDLLSGETFMVMPYYKMGDLRHYLGKTPPTDARTVLKWVCSIVRAVWELHEIGIASMDIKLNNFVVVRDGVQPKVAIIDLGLACSTKLQRDYPALCRLKYSEKGKQPRPKHVAPEMYKSGAQNIFATDIYSLGYAIRRILAFVVRSPRLTAGGNAESASVSCQKTRGSSSTTTSSNFISAVRDTRALKLLEHETRVNSARYAEADSQDRQTEIQPAQFPADGRRVLVALHSLSRIMRATKFQIRPNIARVVRVLQQICVDFKQEDVCFILPANNFEF